MEEKEIKPINFIELFQKIWANRKLYYCILPPTLVITYLITVCVPRYYRCEVSLAPEPTGASSMSGSLGSLASSFGLNSLSKIGNNDALFAEIYPNILQSNDFIADLMTVNVKSKKGDVDTNYYTYLRDKQSAAWWNVVKETIVQWFKPTPKDSYNGTAKLSVFNLTKRQHDIFESAKGKIQCSIDKKTDVVSITVEDQDPLICATMANATCQKLQDFIVTYRTNKARIDYEYYKKLCDKSKEDYVKSRQLYTTFADANQDVFLTSYKAKEEDLENEMQLKYNIYTTMSSQMQSAAAKLQEATPAFTVIQSASVPVKPAGPKRMIISIAMTILAFLAITIWTFVKNQTLTDC